MSSGDLQGVWIQFVGHGTSADDSLSSLLSRYAEPHRRYHGVRHLESVVGHVFALAERPLVSSQLDDIGAIVAAAFFHDAIYDPTKTDNEELSAQLAAAALTKIGWTPTRTAGVATMIEATASHISPSIDGSVLLAADLAILGSDPSTYSDYVAGVREEYNHVSSDGWVSGRAKVLGSFLDREHIFDPALGLDQWEAAARTNISTELTHLSASNRGSRG